MKNGQKKVLIKAGKKAGDTNIKADNTIYAQKLNLELCRGTVAEYWTKEKYKETEINMHNIKEGSVKIQTTKRNGVKWKTINAKTVDGQFISIALFMVGEE